MTIMLFSTLKTPTLTIAKPAQPVVVGIVSKASAGVKASVSTSRVIQIAVFFRNIVLSDGASFMV